MDDQHPQSVQGTNDDSIVSKRSAARFKYINDEYLRCYTPNKAPRRSPLINRGYYIRCKLIRSILAHFASLFPGQQIQVLSLGAGFDTSFWVLKSENCFSGCSMHWFETDFAGVVSRKAAIIRSEVMLSSQIEETTCAGLEDDEIHASDYSLVKGDLRELPALRAKLLSVGLDFDRPTLVFAECVMTYMNPEDSNQVISWASSEFSTIAYLTYEQIVPNDAFGHVMRSTLLQRRSPLLGITAFPTLNCQKNRYLSLGFTSCHIATLLEFYHSLPEEEILRVEHLEEFDELEEWFIKSQHYFVSVATKDSTPDQKLSIFSEIYPSEKFQMKQDHDYTGGEEEGVGATGKWVLNVEPKTKSSLHKHATTRYGHTSTLVQGVCIQGNSDVVVVFGGQCHDRLDDVKLLLTQSSDLIWKQPAVSGASPAKRVFHAAVSFAPQKLLIIGGRGSPRKPHDDVYCLNLESMFWEKWELQWEGEPRPLNRWRHSATCVLGGKHHGKVLIFGGRGLGAGRNEFLAFSDLLLIDPHTRVIKQLSPISAPPARYSHTMTAIGGGKLVLFGGVNNDRRSFNDVHVLDVDSCSWEEMKTSGDIPQPVFSHTANGVRSLGESLDVYSDDEAHRPTGIVVVGGCSPLTRNTVSVLDLSTYIWKSITTSFSTPSSTTATTTTTTTTTTTATTTTTTTTTTTATTTAATPLSTEEAKPHVPIMFTKHTATLVAPNRLCVIGGGALCFSFGNFFNGMNVLCLEPSSEDKFPFLGKNIVEQSEISVTEAATNSLSVDHDQKKVGTRGEIKVLQAPTKEEISELMRRREPAILRGLNFGTCTELWANPEYLKKAETKNFSAREFTEENLDFLNKNYDFKTQPFSKLIEDIFPATCDQNNSEMKRYYFRSIGEDARKQPSDIRTTVPTLAKDFKIPDEIPVAADREFSSVLRVSSKNIRVWTHYDVMDNILCQVVGRKTVTLWHPCEVSNLYVNGSTSQVLDIQNPDLEKFPRFQYASCIVGTLIPGDILFLPSLWFHNTWTEDASISVNVFFKHLSDEQYETKDLYGNKDLIIAEQAMADVTKACERLGNLPAHYSQFYLRKLMDIVESHVTKK